jgi:exodeoxyribonuclease V alpha subunit
MGNLNPISEFPVEVERVIFSDPSEGFSIFLADPTGPDDGMDTFIAKGHVGNVEAGSRLLLWGDWVRHPKYGNQVQIRRFKIPKDSTSDIQNFLSSGFIKGLGPALAQAIVKMFGDETANILDNNPERLQEVSGIGPKKLEGIVETWKKHSAHRKAIVQLQEWGIGPATVQKILKRFEPSKAIEIVEQNPYILAKEIDGVGFLIADKIAAEIGIEKDSPERIEAGLVYTMREASTKEGHCFLAEDDLAKRAMDILFPDDAHKARRHNVLGVIQALCGDMFTREDDRIYLKSLCKAELEVADSIRRLQGGVLAFPYNPDDIISEFEIEKSILLDSKQREAVRSSLSNKVSIVTGGPGTGKTTIVQATLKLAKRAGLTKIGLVAPTGRAAKRLEESSGHAASTIHRFLEYNPKQGFVYNKENQVNSELVVCDEASMLDIYLAKALLSALPNKTRLVLVGDVYQLPSVGPGNVLRDLIRGGEIPVVELSQIHRQSEDSWISRNAHAVKNGKMRDMHLGNKASDFFWLNVSGETPAEKAQSAQDQIIMVVKKLLNKGFSANEIQVLSPMYKTPIGVRELNDKLRDVFNPSGHELRIGNRTFRQGDRVMQLKNDYEKEVFNGDQGTIVDLTPETNEVQVDFHGTPITYIPIELENIVLSYACTIHKSQGSEFPVVVIPVSMSHFIMLQRNLIYTAMTRAKELCILVGDKKALGTAIGNERPILRNTGLAERCAEIL